MHEFSLVQGLFKRAGEIAAKKGARRVLKITMEIGPFSGVVIDSFVFAFDVLKKDFEPFCNCELEIRQSRPSFYCPRCKKEVDISGIDENDGNVFDGLSPFMARTCPLCKEALLSPRGSDEILILQMEME